MIVRLKHIVKLIIYVAGALLPASSLNMNVASKDCHAQSSHECWIV